MEYGCTFIFIDFKFQGLPKTSYYKLIDWWFLVSFNILVLTLGFHTYLSYIVSKATKEPFFKIRSNTKVCPFNNRTEDDDQLIIREHLTKHAVFINNFAKVAFLILLVTFNVLFWTTAYMQHYSPAEDYL